jgi:translation initiation factor 2 subunit 2
MKYEEMLKRVYSQLPPEVFEHKRFELPVPRSTIAGSKTILHNFKEVCDILNREPVHLLKYLSKEMATAGSKDGARVIFQGKFNRDSLEHLIRRYAEQFVICPVCKRPDTKIMKEKRLYFLVCEACGAKSSIRAI